MILTLSLLILTTVDNALGQDKCGGPLSCTPFDDIVVGTAYFSRCSYPTHKLNVDCILSSCPLLSGVCPINSDKTINPIALKKAVSMLNTCIGQNALICGINMSHIPTVQLGWTTKSIIPIKIANGTVNIVPGTGFLDNLSLANFTLIQTDDPKGSIISLQIQAPYVTKTGNYSCTFDMGPNSFLRQLNRLFPALTSLESLHMPNMTGHYALNIFSTVSTDLSSFTPVINILDDHSTIVLNYANFVGADGACLPRYLVDAFTAGMQCLVGSSDACSSAVNFLSTYVALGLRAAQQNCP